jgi:PKD repeat protein
MALPVRPRASSLALSLLLVPWLPARAAAQDAGFFDSSFEGANGSPTESKPESKLWFVDGKWWGILWSPAAQSHSIFRLDSGTQTWIDTGVAADPRPKSRADCLWDGAKLYVASHQFTGGAGKPGHPLLLYRYGYHPAEQRFALDTGFPDEIGDSSTESLVIAKDTTGTLWAVWDRDLRVFVAHTRGDDHDWSVPTVLPSCISDVSSDDIVSIVAFGGNRLGALWSDEPSDGYWFSEHVDGTPDTTWSTRTLVMSDSDDHISLRATSDGRVLAALKTGLGDIRLCVRATNGTWTNNPVTAAATLWTRPILAVDERDHQIFCFATSPAPLGSIRRKFSSLDAIAFAAGNGSAFLGSVNDPSFNDATTTKQNVDGESGLVVLASQLDSRRYGHGFISLGSGPVASVPVAAFGIDEARGYPPLRAQFVDGSHGLPNSWSWSFGDGTTSTQRNPKHTYGAPGTYTVTLTAANARGSDGETKVGAVTVLAAPTSVTLHALEDAQVRQISPDSNYATLPTLRVRADPSSDYHSFVKFLLPATENRVTGATLRLWVEDGGPDGGTLSSTSAAWNESLLSWANAPAFGSGLGELGAVSAGAWVEHDVSTAFFGGGFVAFGIANHDTNSIFYSSREGSHPPELVLTYGTPAAPVAAFEAMPLDGTPQLTVQFFDRSSGKPGTFAWDFGDGATSTLQNPSHTYARPGRYPVSLNVSGPRGSDGETRANYVTVTPFVRRANLP